MADRESGQDEGRSRHLGPVEERAPAVAPRPGYGGLAIWAPADDGPEFSLNLAEYWRLLLKHRILISVIFVSALALGAAATLLMTPIYSASTMLQIDREAARVVSDNVEPQESMIAGEEFFQTQYGLLRSRSLAIRVVDSLNLASSDRFMQRMGTKPIKEENGRASTVTGRREAVLKIVQDNLSVNPVRGSRLVNVTFDSPDPVLAAQVANAFGENFIQSNLDRRFESSSYARDFLERRIAQVKTKLEESERQLVAYATQQQIINLNEGGDAAAGAQSLDANSLAALNASLAQATAARIAAEQRWRGASSGSPMGMPEVLQNPTAQQLIQTRGTLTAEYQQKLRQYQPEFPEMLRLKAQIDETNRQIDAVVANVRSSLREQYVVAQNEENALRGRVNGLKGDVLDLRGRSVQYNILQRELDTSRTLYDGLLQRYKEISVAGGVTTNNISIVDRATPPSIPSKPNILINMALAAAFGLGLGVLSAFVAEALDESLTTPEDVEVKLAVPVLGAIPQLAKGVEPLDALADIRSSFSEAYYSLRTSLQFSTADGVPRTLVVTSARPAEGKTTTCLAIAQNLARVGAKVLLVDADLRNPSLHRLIAAENSRGLSSILSGAATVADAIQPSENPNLWIIPCGPLPPNPAELLGGSRVEAFLAEAQKKFDVVVIDAPPVLGLADAPVLASQAEGTIFVVESRSTRRGQARGALRRLTMANARVLGAVLTKLNVRTVGYGGYDYAYDYQYGAEKRPSKAAKAGASRTS